MVETIVPREMLYIADEVFFSGTAAEITPIRSIDRITIGKGRRGPVAETLQKEFFGIINGTKPDEHGWLAHGACGTACRSEVKRNKEDCATRMTTSPEICHPGCAAT